MKSFKRLYLSLAVLGAIGVAAAPSQAATIAADGGITLYVSYDNLDVDGGVSWNDTVTEVDLATGASCDPTNEGRTTAGAPNSPGQCPGGATCFGWEKLLGDLDRLAEYIYQSTEGAHYLRRVYLSDNGRAWNQADIRWNVGSGGSFVPVGDDWKTPFASLRLNSANRRCIHDVVHHEMGHYFYNLPDRYARSGPYYQGTYGAGVFIVNVNVGDPNTVMSMNFPHLFVDTTNAQLTISYNPGSGWVTNQVLTPGLLTDADPSNDGPNRVHHGFSFPFAQDEWSLLRTGHADLAGVHTEGDFTGPGLALMPDPDYRFLGQDDPYPGTVLLLDRSGSMAVTTNGVPASQYVQEAGMYLYHSSLDGDYVGTNLYNGAVEVLFNYGEYDETNQLLSASFRTPAGLTNIAAALKSAIDALIAEHGADGVNGGKIVLMSDGKQTTGPDLWAEVTRAEDHGIEIHTLSFGDADLPTMEAIATHTGGEVMAMSENTDGSELKLGMARELSELRGLTPLHIYKGAIRPTGQSKGRQIFEGQFELPKMSRALQFYAFLEKGNAAAYEMELEDSAGNVFHAHPHIVADMGRLNGITVPKPKAGTWTYRIMGSKYRDGTFPSSDEFELIAQALNLDLDCSLRVVKAKGNYAGQYVLQGQLFHKYPLMNIIAHADVYFGKSKIATIPLYDDGKKMIDDVAADGRYSALFDPHKFDISDKRSNVRFDVKFTTTRRSRPAALAHYETGTDLEKITKQYYKIGQTAFSA